ncbi:MAG: SRPBCC domain-containing protein [Rhodothermales bacterium]
MPTYQTSFEVNAPADRVWQVLTTLHRYPDWNPQIPLASGTLERGSQINLRLVLPHRPTMDLAATIEEVRPASLLTWRGHVMAPWFFEGYRRFEITPISETQVLVTHVEDIHGLLAPLFSVLMGTAVQKSHVAFNEALRFRAEGGS